MRDAKREPLQVGEHLPSRRPLVGDFRVKHRLEATFPRPAGLAHGIAHGLAEGAVLFTPQGGLVGSSSGKHRICFCRMSQPAKGCASVDRLTGRMQLRAAVGICSICREAQSYATMRKTANERAGSDSLMCGT
jgi:hypothetical protein